MSESPPPSPAVQDLPEHGQTHLAAPRDARKRAAWAAILLLALLWRLAGITHTEVWRDEAVTIIHTQDAWTDLLLRLPKIEDTPPPTFLLFKAWATVSRAEWFLRLLPVLLGVAWVDLMMRTARLIEPRAWWAVGLLAAFSHVPIHYSQEIRAYALLALLTAASLYAVERAARLIKPRAWLLGAAGLAALAGHCHLAGLFVFPAVACYLLIRNGPRCIGRATVGPVVLWMAAVAPLAWFARYWSEFHRSSLDGWWIQPLTARRAVEIAERFFGLETLGFLAAVQQTPVSLWASFVGGRLVLAACVTLVGLGLLGARPRRCVPALFGCTAVYLAALLVSGYVSLPNIWDRTVLPAWTPLMLAIGVGAVAGESRKRRRLGAACITTIAIVWATSWAWNAYHGPPRRPVNNPLFTRLREQIRPQDLIYTWPRWYKELTVYRLADRISADQLLDEYDAYRGSPPRHRLALADPRFWRERLDRQVREHRERHESDFSVWVIHGTLIFELYPDSPEEYIAGAFREADRHEFYSDKVVGYVRYVAED